MRKNRMPMERTKLVLDPLTSAKREPITISQPLVLSMSYTRGISRASCWPSPSTRMT